MTGVRHLVFLLGDQLDPGSAAFDGFDPARDRVALAEVEGEARFVPNHQQRIALFFAAMRHFRDELGERGVEVRYRTIADTGSAGEGATLAGELAAAVQELRPRRVILLEPGRHGLAEELPATARRALAQVHGTGEPGRQDGDGADGDGAGAEGAGSRADGGEEGGREGVGGTGEDPVEVRPDRHFLCSREEFAEWAGGRKSLVMETFYRWMRRRHGVLMDGDGPAGGRWNFDADNRESFGKEGPPAVKEPVHHRPDAVTREVLAEVGERYADLPGSLDAFDWPVTRDEARRALDDFIEHRLPRFGTFQDAMWTGRPWLFHSRLSTALNLKLLDPREVIDQAEAAWREGRAPLNAVEGFVRQVLGWREFLRGVYWLEMPGYLERNALDAHHDLPGFFWDGDTEMACVAEVVGQLQRHAYAHHIQRLMVTGLFALLWGADPRQVHDWYMAMYVDSVEWVTLPNTVGMSQYADGGVVATKPYVATGRYVDRMSDYCRRCPYDPTRATGDDACPFTTLYWDFLARHRERFAGHPRMGLQVRNLERKLEKDAAGSAGEGKDGEGNDGEGEVAAIRRRAEELHRHPEGL